MNGSGSFATLCALNNAPFHKIQHPQTVNRINVVFEPWLMVSCYMTTRGSKESRGWSGGAMVPGKLPVPGRLLIWIRVGQEPTALAVGAGGGCLDIFSLLCHFSFLSPSLSLWETARYRLKYSRKGPLSPKQPASQKRACTSSPCI